jgi:hypothetical protein
MGHAEGGVGRCELGRTPDTIHLGVTTLACVVTRGHPETLNGNSYGEFQFPEVDCIFNRRSQSEGVPGVPLQDLCRLLMSVESTRMNRFTRSIDLPAATVLFIGQVITESAPATGGDRLPYGRQTRLIFALLLNIAATALRGARPMST